MFFLKEILKLLPIGQSKKRIGIKVPKLGWYNKVTASTRIRAYDVIEAFNKDEQYGLELYKPFRKYDLVIFLKNYNDTAYQLAQRLRQKGTLVVFDININIFESGSKAVSEQQLADGKRFANFCDAIITNSPYTQSVLQQKFIDKSVFLINEVISEPYFKVKKRSTDVFTLIWVGYAHKAEALLLIKDVLAQLQEKIPLKLMVIAEKKPNLSSMSIPIEFRAYGHNRILNDLSDADVFVAPRDLTEPYNLGHSFTKVGIAMAAGIPVVASPIPSYQDSPALCPLSDEEWGKALARLHSDIKFRSTLISEGKAYCMCYYGIASVKPRYVDLFKNLLNQSINP